MSVSSNGIMSKSMTVWAGLSISTTLSVIMSLIVSQGRSIIVNMKVSTYTFECKFLFVYNSVYEYQYEDYEDDFQGEFG